MELNLEIRGATLTDLPTILQIEQASRSAAHWPESQYGKALASPERLLLVAELRGQVLGFLVASTVTREWELENIAVAPPARQQGIARALMDGLIARAKRGGASEIRQEIRASNLSAQQLGQATGFQQEGRRRNYYRDPKEDALLFKYLLDRR